MASTKRVLVYGGKGALGSVCVKFFKSKDWWVGSVDLLENDQANANIVLNNTGSLTLQEVEVVDKVGNILQGNKLNAIVCVAGGWAGGNAASDDLIKNTDLMVKQSVWSSVLASKLAAKFLDDGGLLTLTGAKAALDPTPGMIGYGIAKAAVHQLVRSLGSQNSGLPQNSSTLAILPVTLDTPMNRKFMPKADFTTWTPLEYVAELIHNWAISEENRFKSGSLVQLITKEGKTELVVA